MEQLNNMEQQLWEYIDGVSTPAGKSAVEELLKNNSDWNSKYQELLQLNRMLQSSELEQPSLRFTKNVMDSIAKFHIAPATKQYINNRIIWGIGLFFIILLAGFIIYGFSQVNWTTGEAGKNSIGVDFSKIDFSKLFSNTWMNVFMMINIVIGLALLDRVLSAKRKQFRKGMHSN